MTQPPDAAGAPAARPPRAIDRRLLDEVFGDVLPDTTRDERDPGRTAPGVSPGGRGDSAERDRWYEENRPPHHDG